VAIQHALAKRVYFTMEADLDARASEAKVEPSDAGEEGVQSEPPFHLFHVSPHFSDPVVVRVDRCLAAQKAALQRIERLLPWSHASPYRSR
jgi:hypothetical protein